MQNTLAPDLQISQLRRMHIHGVLVRVLDTGLLIIGESGIGKSESALDLISKGHTLVADDVVEVSAVDEMLFGRAPELTFELLEIRGLGIINVRELFGGSAVSSESKIDLCVELQKWAEVERIGNLMFDHEIAGLTIPKFILPVSSGRNLSTLIETAARLFVSRDTSPDAGRLLVERHTALINSIQRV